MESNWHGGRRGKITEKVSGPILPAREVVSSLLEDLCVWKSKEEGTETNKHKHTHNTRKHNTLQMAFESAAFHI